MKSADRNLFGVVIKQETSNGFLSVTELQKAYEVKKQELTQLEQEYNTLFEQMVALQ